MLLLASLLALAPPPRAPLTCPTTARGAAGDPATYCLQLEPVPALDGIASGTVRLDFADSPFGLPLTADGAVRWRPVAHLAGLPAPSALCDCTAYVAWAASPMLTPILRLGVVRNGVVPLGEVALPKFLVLISAERDTLATTFSTPVLRGMSPSALLQPHGNTALPAQSAAEHVHHDGDPWPMPPMHPRAVMPPGLEALRPATAPLLPEPGGRLAGAPLAQGARVQPLPDRASLAVQAGFVTRDLEAIPFTGYGYDGQLTGPSYRVRQGSSATITLRNFIDQPTSVHWHGLRLDWHHDGAVGVSQAATEPSAEHRYRLSFPDAGLFWFHPHVREDVQQGLGLVGTILVAPRDSAWLPPVDDEQVHVLGDVLMTPDGPLPFGATRVTHALMGRFGNVLTLDGHAGREIVVRAGAVTRLWLLDAASTRIFNVSFEGAALRVVAGDLGRFATPRTVDHVTIAPAERYAVDARWEAPGRYPIINRVLGLDPQSQAYFPQVDTVAWVVVRPWREGATAAARAFAEAGTSAVAAGEVVALRRWAARPPTKELLITVQVRDLPFGLLQAMRLDTAYVAPAELAGVMPMMDWIPTTANVRWILRDVRTGRENHDIEWRFRRGERIKLRLRNDRHTLHAMQHPIHLHGQRFAVVARNGQRVADPVWKDTAIVPAGATVDLVVEFDNPGKWMLHCHVPEHLATGMHTVIEVSP